MLLLALIACGPPSFDSPDDGLVPDQLDAYDELGMAMSTWMRPYELGDNIDHDLAASVTGSLLMIRTFDGSPSWTAAVPAFDREVEADLLASRRQTRRLRIDVDPTVYWAQDLWPGNTAVGDPTIDAFMQEYGFVVAEPGADVDDRWWMVSEDPWNLYNVRAGLCSEEGIVDCSHSADWSNVWGDGSWELGAASVQPSRTLKGWRLLVTLDNEQWTFDVDANGRVALKSEGGV